MKLKIELSTNARPSFWEALIAALAAFVLYHLPNLINLVRTQ